MAQQREGKDGKASWEKNVKRKCNEEIIEVGID